MQSSSIACPSSLLACELLSLRNDSFRDSEYHKLPRHKKVDSLDARSARTRDALRAALLVLLEDQSFEQIRARDIAAQAGKGYATFFRQYETKAALLEDLAASEIRQLVEKAMPLIDAPDTRSVCLALCSYVHEHRRLWKALL